MINLIRGPPKNPERKIEARASICADTVFILSPLFRYELVPKKVKEDEFWRNYFYRVSLIKQSFDLKDFEANSNTTNQPKMRTENETTKV